MKIVKLFDDELDDYEKEILKEFGLDWQIKVVKSFTEDLVIKNAKDADIVIALFNPFNKKVLDSLPNLKLIAYRSIGYNSVDIKYANKLNLPISHISDYCIEEVANYVLACILGDNKRIKIYNDSIKIEKRWEDMLLGDLRRLSTQKVGLVGFGNIAKLVAKRLDSFGVRVCAYDPYADQKEFEAYGVEKIELEDLFKSSDYISLHVPMNDKTNKMINKSLFDLIEKRCVLINTARGAIVNEDDLLQALKSGRLAHAYLDVLSSESPNLESELVMHENVTITPHVAFYSEESLRESAYNNLRNIKRFIDGDYDNAEIVNLKNLDLKKIKRIENDY